MKQGKKLTALLLSLLLVLGLRLHRQDQDHEPEPLPQRIRRAQRSGAPGGRPGHCRPRCPARGRQGGRARLRPAQHLHGRDRGL